MIKIIEVPQRADIKISYEVNGEILEITIDKVKETFDFTGLPDGVMEEIEVTSLPINPILSAKKVDGVLTVELLRFYSFEEKGEFENG